ncbi:uncharacterized protein VTP21DRAFT_10458 [Calcarisporiella thermophila]|uniref:uncharacterized protein n=1 Tax=Calcarisporiella thermophila TaxID=911321 RepID=UPI0037439263
MSSLREDLVQQAVKFLQDPKVQTSPLAKKVSFLESKGMTSDEIEEAVSRASGKSSSPTTTTTTVTQANSPGASNVPPGMAAAPGGQMVPYAMAPPLPPRRDWRDVFIACVVAGGFGYGVWTLAKHYLAPMLQMPSSDELEKDKKALDEQFDKVAKELEDMRTETSEAKKTVEEQSSQIKTSLYEMEKLLEELREQEGKRNEELKSLQEEVDNIKAQIPKFFNSSRENQTSMMNDLQQEIKSLKSLLLNRRGTGAPSPTQQTSGDSNSNPLDRFSQIAGTGSASARSSIPAWQLGGAPKEKQIATDVAVNGAEKSGDTVEKDAENSS